MACYRRPVAVLGKTEHDHPIHRRTVVAKASKRYRHRTVAKNLRPMGARHCCLRRRMGGNNCCLLRR
jgi:cytochrome c-type biogenesis protein CcmE